VNGTADSCSEAEGATSKTALVFLFFAVAGPPLGSLIVWASAIVLGVVPSPSARDLSAHLGSLALFAVASYIFGGLQALFVAVVAAIAQSMSRSGLVPFRPVLFASLMASAAYVVFAVVKSEKLPSWDTLLGFASLHVGTALLCALICNTLLWPFRRRFVNQAVA